MRKGTVDTPSLGTLQSALEKKTQALVQAQDAFVKASLHLKKAEEKHEAAMVEINQVFNSVRSKCKVGTLAAK